ncbi:MAG: hypothetical protein ACR2F6_15770 [Mycobacteriales bacterium]
MLYRRLWRKLPDGLAGELTSCAVLALAAVALLYRLISPWMQAWAHHRISALRLDWRSCEVMLPLNGSAKLWQFGIDVMG